MGKDLPENEDGDGLSDLSDFEGAEGEDGEASDDGDYEMMDKNPDEMF